MLAEFKTGPRFDADGVPENAWMGAGACVVGQDVWGKYYEAARRGYVFAASCASTALGAAFTTTPPIALWNPPSSGRNLAVIKSALIITVVQTTLNAVAYGVVPSQTTKPTTGTVLSVISGSGGAGAVGVGQAFGGSTVSAAPTLFAGAYILGTAATTPMVAPCTDVLDGLLIVPPGSCAAMQGVVASGTGSGILTFHWVEVPLISS